MFHSSYLGKDIPERNIFRIPPSPIKLAKLASMGVPQVFIKSIRRIPLLLLRPKMFLHLAVLCARCKEILSQRKIDVIHSMHIDLRTLACIFAVEKEIPVVASAHGFDTIATNSAFTHCLRKLVCQNARVVTIQTEIKGKRLEALYERNFATVPNFLSADRTFFGKVTFNNEHALFRRKLEAKRKLGFKEQDVLILFATRLVKKKGIYELIRSFKQLRATWKFNHKLNLVIGGDGPERDYVKNIAESEDTIHPKFAMSRDQLKIFQAASDIFAFPTSWPETMPMAILESFAHGTPVITTGFEGVEEIMSDGHEGFIIESENADSLASCLRKLAEDNHLRAQMGWNAYRTFSKKFESNEIASKVCEVYEKVVSEHRPA